MAAAASSSSALAPEATPPRRHRRHGARNQHKMIPFTRWLRQTFQHVLPDHGSNIVDVAGGKGELAVRLALCHGHHVVLIDPRPTDLVSCYVSTVLPRLPQKYQDRLACQQVHDPDLLHRLVEQRIQQHHVYLDDRTVRHDPTVRAALANAHLLVGMHADSATELIVDWALQHSKAFCVVPCCVFPNLFPTRVVRPSPPRSATTGTTSDDHESLVPVRTHAQFCDYLLQKDARLQQSILPFDGRNVAIWWDGISST